MYKKAGIVIGILVAVIAIVIFIVARNAATQSESEGSGESISTSGVRGTVSPSTTSPVIAAPVTSAPQTTSTVTPEPVVSEPSGDEPSQEETADAAVLVEIDASGLPAYTNEEDIGTVVGRKVYAYNNQVLFSLIINTTTHGQIEYFTTLTNYNLADGTKVSCSLRVYAAQNGTFPSIISMTTL